MNRGTLILLATVISLLASAYLYIENQELKKQIRLHQLKSTAIDTCKNALVVSDELHKNCSEAYTIVENCVSNQSSCNLKNEAEKLNSLNERKNVLYNQFGILVEELKPIAQEYLENK